MPKEIDSAALAQVQRALGLAGAGAAVSELNDGSVEQVLDIGPLARRGRTLAGSEGIYVGVLRNNHGAANTIQSHWLPYRVAAGQVNAYPDRVGSGFDLWLLGASVVQVSGSGTLLAALSARNWQVGFAHDETDAAVTAANFSVPLAFWDTLTTLVDEFALSASAPFKRIGVRIPRVPQDITGLATDVRFDSVSSAAAVFDCRMLVGLFPTSLGQDALV